MQEQIKAEAEKLSKKADYVDQQMQEVEGRSARSRK